MVEKYTMESRPLTGDVGGISSDEHLDSDELEDGQYGSRPKGQRRSWLILAVFALITNLFSGLGGVYLVHRAEDLDSKCAAHTTQYCK